ncbi:MAG: hypothetical protein J6A52_00515 [Bacilli bacterium]|nr:hypothetical protein [Bacilli bacterium]
MIKKILFTILILFSTFFLMENAYALVQENLYFDIDIKEVKSYINDESNIFYDNKSIKYYLEYFKDYIENNNPNNYNYTILYKSIDNSGTQNQQIVIIFHNGTNPIQVSFEGLKGSRFQISNFLMGGRVYLSFDVGTTSYENQWNNRLTALDNILKNGSTTNSWNNFNFYFPLTSFEENISLSSNMNYFVPYYSSFENSLLYYLRSTSDTAYYRSLKYNNSTIDFNQYIEPLEVYINIPDTGPTFVNNSFIPTYNGLFLSNIPKENIDDYVAEFSLGRIGDLLDYNYDVNIFGRINHGTYYTYDKLDCSYQITSDEPYYEDFGLQKDFIQFQKKYFEFTTCRSDLSNYDNIYVNLHMLNSLKVFNFSSSANYGYIYPNDSFNRRYDNFLDFYNLNSNNALMVSYKSTPNNAYYGSINDTITSTIYRKENMQKWDYVYFYPIDSKPLKFYKYTDVMPNSTFLLESSTSSDTAYVLVDENTMVSFNNNYKLDNKFTYYEDSNTILENDFIIYQQTNIDDSYDVDNYLTIIKDFIDSLSSDINQFSLVLQNCYDLAPEFIRTIIFVLFILTMSYILFKLIGK